MIWKWLKKHAVIILFVIILIAMTAIMHYVVFDMVESAKIAQRLGADKDLIYLNKKEINKLIALGISGVAVAIIAAVVINRAMVWKWLKKYAVVFLLVVILIAMTVGMYYVVFNTEESVKIAQGLGANKDFIYLNKKETIKLIALGMSGVVAAIVAAVVNRRADAQDDNNELVQKGHDDTRFQNIVRDLGHGRANVRISAFYRFYYLASKKIQSDKFRQDVFEILCACLRTISSGASHVKKSKHEYDIERQALLDVLFKGKFKGNPKKRRNLVPSEFLADLHGAHFDNLNLSNADLSNANLSGTNLSGTNLSKANLLDANLSGANLWGADLSGANLSGANLLGVYFLDADLSDADLSDADFSGANLSGANLSNTNLSGANLSNTILPSIKFSGANLSGVNLSFHNLKGANLSGANLSVSNFSEADFSGANLSGANFLGSNLSKASFSDSNLSYFRLWYAKYLQANFANINLNNVSNLKNADLRGATKNNVLMIRDDIPEKWKYQVTI